MIRSKVMAVCLFIVLTILISACSEKEIPEVMQWHKIELVFEGPSSSEEAEINPFTDYRLNVTFKNQEKKYIIPGFYAADGNAAETSSSKGNVWKVRFRPDRIGLWEYEASFVKGKNIAVSNKLGEKVEINKLHGKINVTISDKTGHDFRAKGRLNYSGERYLRFQNSDSFFLKAGTDSPENFLAYFEFDNTYSNHNEGKDYIHRYASHITDWKNGDPTWKNGKGKAIIGSLNYLASRGINSVYMLTMNIDGDGHDVWPFINDKELTRYDCSKLDQWEIVFDHMDHLGIMQHFVTQETENEMLLDEGETSNERKLYYRELIARFGHHPAITWNMGEETGHYGKRNQDTRQIKDMINYMSNADPYNNFIVLHTASKKETRYEIIEPLLGLESLDGPSMQIRYPNQVHSETLTWLEKSKSANKQWVVCIDEIGPAAFGIDEDSVTNNNQDSLRWNTLWGNLMAGGAGVEWYFGYKSPNSDLKLESWKTRDRVWKFTSAATNFFQKHIPFTQMTSSDFLLNDEHAYCFSKQGEVYAIYDWRVDNLSLDLTDQKGLFNVYWYDPIKGGDLVQGEVSLIEGGTITKLGDPPSRFQEDWVILIKKQS